MTAGRLAATFSGPPAREFLREPPSGAWTVGRLLAYAGDVRRAVPPDAGPLVAVRGHSAAFVFASALGLWADGRAPLLVDPSLAREPSVLRGGATRVRVLAPASARDPWADTLVAESGGAPIAPRFPSAGEPEVAFFTSGSTGEPKVVRKLGFQLSDQHVVEAPWLGFDGPVSVLSFVPAFHILGYIYAFSTPAAGGGRTLFACGAAPQTWIEQVRAERPALVVGVPSHYRLMAQLLTAPLPEATYLCSGGPLDPAVAEEFHRRAGRQVLQVYGSTETGGVATRLGSGPWRPFPSLRWRAREGDARLMIDSPWQDRPGDWYVTDDVIAEEGETFRLLGRSDSVVKIGGRRFSTGEIVQAALALPAVGEAHAVVYSRFGEPAVALFVVSREGAVLDAADVRAGLAARIAGFKVPRTIRVLAELPTRGIGKVDEDALRALATGQGLTA